jgi:prevent-host-death family protein
LYVQRSIIVDLTEDIRSVTDLKRHTREILDHVHATGRPVVLTVNGRADAVILDAAVYQTPAEAEAAEGRTRSASEFISEFKRVRNVQR